MARVSFRTRDVDHPKRKLPKRVNKKYLICSVILNICMIIYIFNNYIKGL
jgi:hypothetical protein